VRPDLDLTFPAPRPASQQLGNIDAYNFARKPAYDFGWDWGPGLGASGIYGSVALTGYDTALLRSAHVRQVRAPSAFLVRVEPELVVPAGGDAGVLVAEIPSLGLKSEARLEFSTPGRGLGSLELVVPADAVDLWWPVGYGAQPLYDMTVKWTSLRSSPDASSASSTLQRRVGFRTVELVEKPLSEAAEELFGKAGGGWDASVSPGWGVRACAGMNNCGQYGWVDGKKWTFISTEQTPSLDHPVSGFDFAGAFPNSSMPGGDNPWSARAGRRQGRAAGPRQLDMGVGLGRQQAGEQAWEPAGESLACTVHLPQTLPTLKPPTPPPNPQVEQQARRLDWLGRPQPGQARRGRVDVLQGAVPRGWGIWGWPWRMLGFVGGAAAVAARLACGC
jgi:hypothetical protein